MNLIGQHAKFLAAVLTGVSVSLEAAYHTQPWWAAASALIGAAVVYLTPNAPPPPNVKANDASAPSKTP